MNKYNKLRKPSFILFTIFYILLYPFFKLKHNVRVRKDNFKNLKDGYIILVNHPSKLDFLYAGGGIYPKTFYSVYARNYSYNKKIKYLLDRLGGIPKDLYNHDISVIRNILTVKERKGIILMMPEGKLSIDSTSEKITDGTEKLIKKLRLPVVISTIKGAYFTKSKWMKKSKRGKIEVRTKLLYSAEDIDLLSEEEIYERIKKELYYDDYKYLEDNPKLKYKGRKFLNGLESILFICPCCKSEFKLKANNYIFKCLECNYELKSDKRFKFSSTKNNVYYDNIKDWYKYQESYLRNIIINNKNYYLEDKVLLKMPINMKLELVGNGVCRLDNDGLTYKGYINDKYSHLNFPLEVIKDLLFGANENFEIYKNNTYYYFVPSNPLTSVKWSIVFKVLYEINIIN